MVRSEIEKVKEAIKSDNAETIKAATDAFQQKFYEISEKLYKQQGGDAGYAGDSGAAGTQNDDGSFNADFTEK